MNRRERRAAAQKNKKALRGAATLTTLVTAESVHVQASESPDVSISSDKTRSTEPNHQDSLYLAGLAAMQAGQNDYAVDCFVHAVRLTPKVEYVSALGTALQRQGRFEEALKAFDKAASLQPDNALHWKDLGAVLIDLGRPDEALLSLRQALKLSSQYADAANLSGLIHYRGGRFAEALESFNVSLAGKPNQADALHMRALVFQNLGQFEEAAADGFRSQKLDPTNADTHNNLGYAGMTSRWRATNEPCRFVRTPL